MFEREVLVGKLCTVDRLAAGAVVPGKIATLTHEPRNDAVKRAALVAVTLFTRAQCAEVLRRPGHHVRAQLDHDPAQRLTICRHVKEAAGEFLLVCPQYSLARGNGGG
jgi:hypothetical protein